MAHEIGNPLNSLYLNLQLISRSLSGSAEDELPPGETAKMIDACTREVERLDSIIHGFLTAIRPGKPQFAPADIRELVVDVLRFMQPEIEARKVSVKCEWGSALPPVSGDAAQLKQLFYNIIRNAVQAMTNGGELTIIGYADMEFLSVEFADTGCGVSAKNLSSIFHAFKTTKSGGNGIGTMIIERICREHGAAFGLVSEPERGTVFQVRFPLGGKRLRMLGDSSLK